MHGINRVADALCVDCFSGTIEKRKKVTREHFFNSTDESMDVFLLSYAEAPLDLDLLRQAGKSTDVNRVIMCGRHVWQQRVKTGFEPRVTWDHDLL